VVASCYANTAIARTGWKIKMLIHRWKYKICLKPVIHSNLQHSFCLQKKLIIIISKNLKIRLSQAIIGMEKEDITNADTEFRSIIYCSSGNRFLISTMNQLNTNNHLFFKTFNKLSEFEKDSVFADYVDILNGLKKEDAFFVKETVEKNILRMCELLIKYEDLKMPELITDAIKMNENRAGQALSFR